MKIASSTIVPTNSTPSLATRVCSAVADHPLLVTTDLVDLGVGCTLGLGLSSINSSTLMNASGFVLGGYHATMALLTLHRRCKQMPTVRV